MAEHGANDGAGLWSIMPWDLDKACGNTKGQDDWPYNYPFGALNNHGLKVSAAPGPRMQAIALRTYQAWMPPESLRR